MDFPTPPQQAKPVSCTAARGLPIPGTDDERTAQEARPSEDDRFRAIFDRAPVGVGLVALDEHGAGRFELVNDAFCRVTGHDATSLVGRACSDVIHADDAERDVDLYAKLLAGEVPRFTTERRYLRPDGSTATAVASVSLLESDGARYAVEHVEDITERRRFEGKLAYVHEHDVLTGLFNRRRFVQELEREISYCDRYESGGAVLLLDLDHFKYINDTAGHRLGDQVLGMVGELLRRRLRDSDTLAHLGQDEYGILLPRATAARARWVAQELVETVRSHPLTFDEAEARLSVTATIGIALLEARGELSAEDVLALADAAMYDAKDAGRDRIALYEPAKGREERMRVHVTWVEAIRRALDAGAFTLHYQPVVELESGAVAGQEALVRMQGERGELVLPDAFLPVGATFGLIQRIDRWVVSEAVRALAADPARFGPRPWLTVNLSEQSMSEPDLVEFIEDELAAHDVDPGSLTFEVTERAAIANLDRARHFIERLRALGCSFALDDFGGGFASFYYLKYLPFDYLKIDGEFIRKLAESRSDQLVVHAIATTALGLGKKVIAEYVSDDASVALLREYGVRYGQGFHVGHPVPLQAPARGRAPSRRARASKTR